MEAIVTLWAPWNQRAIVTLQGLMESTGPLGHFRSKENIVTLKGLVEPREYGTGLAGLASQWSLDRSS